MAVPALKIPINMIAAHGSASNYSGARKKNFKIVNGVAIDVASGVDDGQYSIMGSKSARGQFTTSARDNSSAKTARARVPSGVKKDYIDYEGKFLNFKAYFKEAVAESAEEQYRVRKAAILYYLENGQIEIVEPKQPNSGIPQGKFLKRAALPKNTGSDETWTWKDLSVNMDFCVYSRTFRIYDCDKFTRQFFVDKGSPLPEPEGDPTDEYSRKRDAFNTAKVGLPQGKKNSALKQFMEASLGKPTHSSHRVGQFLDNDRKVLQFECEFDDTSSLHGELMLYTMNFFLSDSTIEIKEKRQDNSGRDNFPLMLRRMRLPKNAGGDTARQWSGDAVESDFVSESDLEVGQIVKVYNRDLKIVDCDDFTRQFFKKTLSFNQPAACHTETPSVEAPEAEVAPYNGFGTEEDSEGSCSRLVPKVPKKDFNKFMQHNQKVLRFSARMMNVRLEQAARTFILAYYLSDDTVAIYEPTQRNSGIVGGKFLQRAKYKSGSGAWYTLGDFNVGSTARFNSHEFEIFDADDYTKRFLLLQNDPVEIAKLEAQLNDRKLKAEKGLDVIRAALAKRSGGQNSLKSLIRQFKIMDDNSSGTLSYEEAKFGLADFGIELTDEQLSSVFSEVDGDGSGQISLQEFNLAVMGKLNTKRKALIGEAFKVLDQTGDGKVDMEDLVGTFNAKSHPDVASGKRSEEDVMLDFMGQWDTLEKDGIVTREEFEEYYKGISCLIDSDDYFELMITNAWHIASDDGKEINTANLRVRVTHTDNTHEIVTIRNDLGLDKNNTAAIVSRLKKQGVSAIKRVELSF